MRRFSALIRNIIVLASLFAALQSPSIARADNADSAAFEQRVFTDPHGGSIPYCLFVPRNLNPAKRYPVVLFLHGSGERGMDNKRQVRDIAAWTHEDVQVKYPCFIVAPQCPNWREVFQVYGRSTDQANLTYRDYAGSEKQWKHFRISPGRQAAGKMNWLFFINDDWGKSTQIDSSFRNVKVCESGQEARTKPIDFRKAEFTPYGGGGRGNNPTVVDDGATVQFVGDTRKKIPISITVTKNTVIDFDFKCTVQGNLHGIGLDDDDKITEERWVDTDWGAEAHKQPAEPSAPMKLVMDLLPALEKEYPSIDPRRKFLTGLSMGGFGVWDLLARRPDWFAAGVPICGGADLATANTLAAIPIWAFHGSQDGTVRPDRSRSMIAALWEVGGEPRYTEYLGVGHDSWKRAYAEPDLLAWLFAQQRNTAAPAAPANLRAAVIGSSRVELTWNASQNAGSAIKEYRILRDGSEIGETAEARFTDREIAEGDVHNYAVVAVNRARIKSPPTPVVWAKSPPDTSPLNLTSAAAQGIGTIVELTFDKPVSAAEAGEAGNYKIDHGIAVTRATLLPSRTIVRLETTPLSPQIDYTAAVVNLKDMAAHPNPVAQNTKVKFVYDPCLSAHWRLDEGEGAFAADATGNGAGSGGNVITFHSLDWIPGKFGKALGFDGISSHYAWTVQSKSLDLIDAVTVSLWIKKSPGEYGHQILIAKSNHLDRRTQFMLDYDPSHQIRATIGTLDHTEISVIGHRLDARDWHHLALTFSHGTLELFIDGESQGKASGGDKLMSVSEAITIGAGYQGRDQMRGSLDEIRIYNRGLSPTEIKALATATSE